MRRTRSDAGTFRVNLVGERFGRLTVVERIGMRDKHAYWRCRCDCGAFITTATSANLRSGGTQSCGCLRREALLARFTKHGRKNTREYHSWMAAKHRCYNPNDRCYKDYGGRGIAMCDRWRHDFSTFFADMGPCPAGRSIDRINNDGPYAPDNCRWATTDEQAKNKRRNGPLPKHR